eukprot:jgi/Botrbrau1/12524/Bobra.0169s0066.1
MSGGAGLNLAAKLEAERKLKEGISGHRTGLPKRLLELFAPLDPPKVLTPLKKRPPRMPYRGVGEFVVNFAEPGDPAYEPPRPATVPPEPRRFRNPELDSQARVDKESLLEKRIRLLKEREEKGTALVEEGVKEWDPVQDPNVQGDPFKTLFVGRLSYDVTEKKLRREFEEFGAVKRVRLVVDRNSSKPRGYAFIEYEHKEDMKTAYKSADGRKIEGRRVLVDVERGRTVPNWRPRRLGGGKGGETRESKEPKNPTKRMALGLPPVSVTAGPTAPPAGAPPPERRPPPSRGGPAPSLGKYPGDRPPREDRPPPREDRPPPRDTRGPPRDARPPRDEQYGPPPRDDRHGPPSRDDRHGPPSRDDRHGPSPEG